MMAPAPMSPILILGDGIDFPPESDRVRGPGLVVVAVADGTTK